MIQSEIKLILVYLPIMTLQHMTLQHMPCKFDLSVPVKLFTFPILFSDKMLQSYQYDKFFFLHFLSLKIEKKNCRAVK